MINFKKMDDKDFVFVNKPLTGKEEKKFSDFLMLRKAEIRRIESNKKREGSPWQIARASAKKMFILTSFSIQKKI